MVSVVLLATEGLGINASIMIWIAFASFVRFYFFLLAHVRLPVTADLNSTNIGANAGWGYSNSFVGNETNI